MTRDALLEIFKKATAIEGNKTSFRVPEGHDVSFYLQLGGQAIVVSGVRNIELGDTLVEIQAREHGQVFTTCESVGAVSVRTTDAVTGRRAGFG